MENRQEAEKSDLLQVLDKLRSEGEERRMEMAAVAAKLQEESTARLAAESAASEGAAREMESLRRENDSLLKRLEEDRAIKQMDLERKVEEAKEVSGIVGENGVFRW